MTTSVTDLSLWDVLGATEPIAEDAAFLREQLITYIGNKRSLLHTLDRAVTRVRGRLGKEKLRILDAFAGSGVVSRFFKQHSELLVSNDLERYAKVIGDCYLRNRSSVDFDALRQHHRQVVDAAESLPVRDGFIRRLYAPQRDDAIQPGERAFYTTDNAMRIDSLRYLIGFVPRVWERFLLALLMSSSI